MRVASASAKGGTGKTLLSTSLAWSLAQDPERRLVYADADVEVPGPGRQIGRVPLDQATPRTLCRGEVPLGERVSAAADEAIGALWARLSREPGRPVRAPTPPARTRLGARRAMP
ncbi:MAG: hypothetical protein CSA66_07145 [Proteobacteria bacterium]|nr:MAG: hypothetical protein CSA66_07145 [Pseudomonadota bacterium]